MTNQEMPFPAWVYRYNFLLWLLLVTCLFGLGCGVAWIVGHLPQPLGAMFIATGLTVIGILPYLLKLRSALRRQVVPAEMWLWAGRLLPLATAFMVAGCWDVSDASGAFFSTPVTDALIRSGWFAAHIAVLLYCLHKAGNPFFKRAYPFIDPFSKPSSSR